MSNIRNMSLSDEIKEYEMLKSKKKKVPNLHWTLSSELNTKPKTLQVKEEIPTKITVKLENQTQ